MGGYIGATAVGLTTTAADVQGDITSTDTTPELILKNTSEEDTEGGREGKITFKGEQSGGEESTLAQIESAHDGTSDDQKGDLIFKTNDGSDGASPTERMRIDSTGSTTITTEGNEDSLVLKSTDADANAGPKLQFNRNSASPADADLIGEMRYTGQNDAGEDVDYARIRSQISDVSDGTEDGQLQIATIVAGTMRRRVDFDPTETVFNDASQDIDFRVESDGNANMLFVDAGNDNVGIGTGSPSLGSSGKGLHLKGPAGNSTVLKIDSTTTSQEPQLQLTVDGTDKFRIAADNSTNLKFVHSGIAERMRIDSSGNLLVGKTSTSRTTVGCEARGDGFIRATADGDKSLELVRKTSDGEVLEFFKDSSLSGIMAVVGNDLAIGTGNTGLRFTNASSSVQPIDMTTFNRRDNAIDLGHSSYRFDDIFATNGTIQTSDRNEKQDIEDLSEAELRVATAAKGLIKKYRWIDAVEKKGDDARIHVGIIAQDLQAAFEAEGLDAGRYAMFISDTWWEADRVVPAVEANEEEGIEAVAEHTVTDTFDTQEEAPEGATERTRLGVRYPELLAFIIGAM